MTSPETKIYVGCGLTNAPAAFRAEVEAFKNVLRKKYETFNFLGLEAGTAADVYNWDINDCVANCDLFVAICDEPSIGLGYELRSAIERGKPVLGVAHEQSKITRLALGAAEIYDPQFTFRRYGSLLLEAPQLVDEKVLQMRSQLVLPPGTELQV
ncbi:MAG: hypothetical protein JWO35_358 [Candidatus Saccharibacteria bacterium]|nr:hypothetical protein [Candidatus Saccharibacteria bacterium]